MITITTPTVTATSTAAAETEAEVASTMKKNQTKTNGSRGETYSSTRIQTNAIVFHLISF